MLWLQEHSPITATAARHEGGIVMDKVSVKLTVFFEEPFWIGVFERISEGKLSACKMTFGAEPKDYEVYAFILKKLRSIEI